MKYLLPFIIVCFSCQPGTQTKRQTNWVEIENPTGINSSLPFLTTDEKGSLLMSWVEQKEDTTNLLFSLLTNEQWSEPRVVSSGVEWFVNWADYPSVVSSESGMMGHFLQKSSSETYSYDVHITQSLNRGLSWTQDFIPHTDNTPTEHGFVSILPYKGDFLIVWLDGRNTGGEGNHGEAGGAMTLRSALIDAEGVKVSESALDDRVCDCCQTTATLTENGPVIFYRDRSVDEIRDISIIRWDNDKWTNSQTLWNDNWKIAGCPVNGPKAVSMGSKLAVAWFTAADNAPEVKVMISEDSGKSFYPPIKVDRGNPAGRVDLAFSKDGQVVVSWMEMVNEAAMVLARKVKDGSPGPVIEITSIDASRQSGFPQLETVNDNIYIAFTDVAGSRIRLIRGHTEGLDQ